MVLGHSGSSDSSSPFRLLRSTKSLSVATPSPRPPRGRQPVEKCRGQNWHLYPWRGSGVSLQPLCSPARLLVLFLSPLFFSLHTLSHNLPLWRCRSPLIAKKIKAPLFPLPRVLSRQAGRTVGGIFVRLPVLTLLRHMSHQAEMDEDLLNTGSVFLSSASLVEVVVRTETGAGSHLPA